MSEKHDAEGATSSDSINRRIEDMLEDVRASGAYTAEESMAPAGEALLSEVPEKRSADSADKDAEFIDLDAEQLLNSTDFLQLDETELQGGDDALLGDDATVPADALHDIDLGEFSPPLDETSVKAGEHASHSSDAPMKEDKLELGDFPDLVNSEEDAGETSQQAIKDVVSGAQAQDDLFAAEASADFDDTLVDEAITELDEAATRMEAPQLMAESLAGNASVDEEIDALLDSESLDSGESLEELVVKEASSLISGGRLEVDPQAGDGLAATHLKELEQRFDGAKAGAAPVPEARWPVPVWFNSALAMMALLLSALALWFSFNAAPLVPDSSDTERALVMKMQTELVALRKRLKTLESEQSAAAEVMRGLSKVAEAQAAAAEPAELPVSPPQQNAGSRNSKAIAPSTKPGVKTVKKAAPLVSAAAVEPKPTKSIAVQKAKPAGNAGKVFVKGWAVNLRSFYRRADAELLAKMYQEEGIDAEIRDIPKDGSTWHRVRVMGFVSKKDAEVFIDSLTVEQGRDMAWASYYEGYVER